MAPNYSLEWTAANRHGIFMQTRGSGRLARALGMLPTRFSVVGLILCAALAGPAVAQSPELLVKDLLDTCRLISERDSSDEAWFWFQAHRAEVTAYLWNARGVRALKAELRVSEESAAVDCLKRALREAHRGEIEHY